jgi:hypothetical protein
MTDAKENPWQVFNYEVYMLFYTTYLSALYTKQINGNIEKARLNAIVESRLLHIRILTELLLSNNKNPDKDNIVLEDIVPIGQQNDKLESYISELRKKYGTRKNEGSPRWTLNKMLAHPSRIRGSSYNYQESVIDIVCPVIEKILWKIQELTCNNQLKQHLVFAQNNLRTITWASTD